jgi:hypothetical protein
MTHTPWGPSQQQTAHGEIVFHSTASHGGFFVPPHLREQMPMAILAATHGSLGLTGWFEEDCDANYVVAWFRQDFAPNDVTRALNALRLDLSHAEQRAKHDGNTSGYWERRYRLKVDAMNAMRLAQGAQLTVKEHVRDRIEAMVASQL